MKVRYGKTSGWSDWIECRKVTLDPSGALIIELSETSIDMVPLHYIQGTIEVREVPLPPPSSPDESDSSGGTVPVGI